MRQDVAYWKERAENAEARERALRTHRNEAREQVELLKVERKRLAEELREQCGIAPGGDVIELVKSLRAKVEDLKAQLARATAPQEASLRHYSVHPNGPGWYWYVPEYLEKGTPGPFSRCAAAVADLHKAESTLSNDEQLALARRLDYEIGENALFNSGARRLTKELASAREQLVDVRTRVATIACENFGPLPAQGSEENLSAIEQGIFYLRRRLEAIRRERNEARPDKQTLANNPLAALVEKWCKWAAVAPHTATGETLVECANELHKQAAAPQTDAPQKATERDRLDDDPAPDDVDPEDSARLLELREAIDHHLGWGSAKEKADGDYVARIVQVEEGIFEQAAQRGKLIVERDRLRQQLQQASVKHQNYKREIKRLQAALLRQRGQWRSELVEHLELRVKALEAKAGIDQGDSD